MSYILSTLFIVLSIATANADVIKMYGKEKYGFEQPKYEDMGVYEKNTLILTVLAKNDDFPLSSVEQGSVFNKIFLDLQKYHIANIIFVYPGSDYHEQVESFERGELIEINARFGVYFEEYPYSKNEYLYPAVFENKVYIITSARNKLTLNDKGELKNYKGLYIKKDNVSSYVLKEFIDLGMTETTTYSEAYQKLLTGEADYIAASYYPSLIALYKEGIRDYVVYSKAPVWKMSMFLRVKPNVKAHPKYEMLQKYLRSSQFKKTREDAFNEVIEIYKNTTSGIVPPTYIKSTEENSTDNQE